MYTVKLIRGPLETKEFPAEEERRAYRRAVALAELHSCQLEEDSEGRCYVVDASRYYKNRS